VERDWLDSLPNSDRERAFMAVWARKEAYGKALGVGIGFELRAVTVGPTGRRVRGVPGRWQVAELDVAPDYAGAVVTAGRARVASRRIDAAVLLRR
jgi:4'-phosphopantetheinyl transferase